MAANGDYWLVYVSDSVVLFNNPRIARDHFAELLNDTSFTEHLHVDVLGVENAQNHRVITCKVFDLDIARNLYCKYSNRLGLVNGLNYLM